MAQVHNAPRCTQNLEDGALSGPRSRPASIRSTIESPPRRRHRPAWAAPRRWNVLGASVSAGPGGVYRSERLPRERAKGFSRARLTASRLRMRFSRVRHVTQCRWTGEVRSTTWWQRAHSRSATASQSRDRPGRVSGISLVKVPSRFSTRPAPARRSHSHAQSGQFRRIEQASLTINDSSGHPRGHTNDDRLNRLRAHPVRQ